MNDIDQLTRYLHTRAGAADLGHTPVGVITRAGTRRRNRHRAVSTAGVLAVGALGTVATVQVLGSGAAPRRIATDPVSTQPQPTPTTSADEPSAGPSSSTTNSANTADPGAAVVDSPLVWNEVMVGSAESITALSPIGDAVNAMPQADGSYYQASSAPGRTPGSPPGLPAPMLYHSQDGIHWESRPEGIFDGRISPLAVDGDRLYAVSSAPAGVRPGPTDEGTRYAAFSTNGGTDWSTSPLPYDVLTIRSNPGIEVASLAYFDAATSDSGVVISSVAAAGSSQAAVATRLGVESTSLEPNPDGSGYIVHETTPIDCAELEQLWEQAGDSARQPGVRSGDTCFRWGGETARYSWADLGMDEATQEALRGAVVLFHSDDGGRFTRVASPPELDEVRVIGAQINSDEQGYVLAVTGSTSSLDDGSNPMWLFRSVNGIDWTALPEVPEGGCGFWGGYPSMTTDAIVLYASRCGGGLGANVFRDGAWNSIPLDELVAPNESTGATWTAAGPAGLAVAMQVGIPTGSQLDSSEAAFESSSLRWVLLFSRDGQSWSQTELADITDVGARSVSSVRVTSTNVLVTLREPVTDREAPLPDVTVLVGTLA